MYVRFEVPDWDAVRWDKMVTIPSNSELILMFDYDDVNPKVVRKLVEQIVQVLNDANLIEPVLASSDDL